MYIRLVLNVLKVKDVLKVSAFSRDTDVLADDDEGDDSDIWIL
jgi:hypothetical protein